MIKAFLLHIYHYSTINNVYIDISFGSQLEDCLACEQLMWIVMSNMDPYSKRWIKRVIDLKELEYAKIFDDDIAIKDYITSILDKMRDKLKEEENEHR